jgi:cell division protein FtsQ
MNPAELQSDPGRSWRQIRQEVRPRAMSGRGLRRRVAAGLKLAALCGAAGALAWGAYELAHAWNTDRPGLTAAAHGSRVARLVATTDGVLTRDWVEGQLAVPRQATLMSLDLAALRDRLLAHGQVKAASVSRQFPDKLVVALEERRPVARVQVQDGAGPARVLLVAADGVVFPGINHEKTLVTGLPWLAGFNLRRAGANYAPVAGMDAAARLLTAAQIETPWLYEDWVVVSLERLAGHGELAVTSAQRQEFTFAAEEDFLRQLARLDYVLDRAAETGVSAPASVNLALGDHVPVRFDPARPTIAEGPPPPANRFSLPNLAPLNHRRTTRDL